MDWFEQITGFRELPYEETQAKLRAEDGFLCSSESMKKWAIGMLETPKLAELRERAAGVAQRQQQTQISCIVGDARRLHSDPAARGALFQVASQFNLLEMTAPHVTPEAGVTRYASDKTQGPACAIAAGAGTIFRNYLAPLGESTGQRADRQIDCGADLRTALHWEDETMGRTRNGYLMCTARGLKHVEEMLERASADELDTFRGMLRIGIQWHARVTDSEDERQLVSQAYCSALPVAYGRLPARNWQRFATLVLEAAYEATLLAGVLNAGRTGSNVVMLTRLGGGAFGNDPLWINAALQRALDLVRNCGLDVRIVCFGQVPSDLQQFCATYT